MTLDLDRLEADFDALAPRLRDVALKIHANPELRFEEHRAAAWLASAVEDEGLSVERDLGGLPTVDGGRVRTGLLYRSDSLALLSEADVDRVTGELGLRMALGCAPAGVVG